MNDETANPLFFTPFLPLERWCEATFMSKAKARRLLNAEPPRLTAKKDGRITRIVDTPASYLGALPAYQKGTMPPGPGRGHKGPMTRGSTD